MVMQTIALIVFVIFAVIGGFLSLVGIGGTFIIATGAALYDLLTWSLTISWTMLLILFGLAVLGEILEHIIMMYAAKKKGVSNYGMVGMFIGAIAGAILLSAVPLIGTIIGVFLGGALGAFILEYVHKNKTKLAWQAAKAALLGRGLVALTKTTIAVVQVVLVVRAI